MKKAQFFNESEFQKCTPSCSMQDMRQGTLDRLDAARALAGIPFVLNSAVRSKAWELSKGRTGTSSHVRGYAVDIRCNTDRNRFLIVRALIEAGFTRIGIAKTYIHADDDPNKTQLITWLY